MILWWQWPHPQLGFGPLPSSPPAAHQQIWNHSHPDHEDGHGDLGHDGDDGDPGHDGDDGDLGHDGDPSHDGDCWYEPTDRNHDGEDYDF